MTERKAAVRQMATGYRRAGKKDNGRSSDEVVALTGYNRRYAIGLLGGVAPKVAAAPKRRLARVRERLYDTAVLEALRRIWVIMDCMKLMFAAIIRASKTWRGVAVREFERKQLATLREELNQKFEEQHDLKVKPASRSRKLQRLWDLTTSRSH
jgi:hypothetical protein